MSVEPGSTLAPVLRDHANRLSGAAISEALDLCGLQLGPREPDRRSRRDARETGETTAQQA